MAKKTRDRVSEQDANAAYVAREMAEHMCNLSNKLNAEIFKKVRKGATLALGYGIDRKTRAVVRQRKGG